MTKKPGLPGFFALTVIGSASEKALNRATIMIAAGIPQHLTTTRLHKIAHTLEHNPTSEYNLPRPSFAKSVRSFMAHICFCSIVIS